MTNLDFFAVRVGLSILCFFFSSRRRHTRFDCDWSSDVWSSDLTDRGLGGGNGQYKKNENLPRRIVVKMSERDEVHVDREQHKLDRHQEHDDVFAIQENSDDRESEERRVGKEGRSGVWEEYEKKK